MPKPTPPKPNLLERAIASVAPGWALKRHQARGMMALSGGYVGAGYAERFSGWMPGQGDADADTVLSLPELRGRSRDLVRNSPIAAGAIETQVSHVVGTGLTLQSRIDHEALGMSAEQASERQKIIEREFKLWCESKFCDATAQQNFYELQDLTFRSFLESGDTFPVLAGVTRPGWPYRLALQIIEADRVRNTDDKGDTESMVQGIEKNAAGEPVAVHICNRHPGRWVGQVTPKWTRVTIRGASSGRLNVIHLMRKTRPGQTRGIPALAPIIALLKQMDRFANAEVDAAVNSATMALFVRMETEAFQDLFKDEAQQKLISQAQEWDEEIQSPTPGRPNPEFDPFFTACLKQIGIGLNVPYEVLAKHFSSSYSAARAALLDAWRTFKIRRTWLADNFCQPVYEEWFAEAVTLGRVEAPGFFADPAIRKAWCGSKWSGDGPGAIDPEKEANAAEKRMAIGLSSLPEEKIAYDGGDWETSHAMQKVVKERRIADGLEQDPAAAAAPAAGRPGAPPPAPRPAP